MKFIEKLEKEKIVIRDKQKLIYYLEEKSVYRYTQILEMMLTFHRPLSDIHLNDFYRYDVRIRRLLFKYLTAYEISLRGQVLNNLREGHDTVERLTFGQLIDKYYPSELGLKKVKDLRNKIFHHYMIQLLDIKDVIGSINIMLDRLDRKKFLNELLEKQRELSLIKAFIIDGDKIMYDYLGEN